MDTIKILPSIASADQLCLWSEMKKIDGTGLLHIDIEDGNYIPNITFGMKTVRAICRSGGFEYDAHLLVADPGRYIDELNDCGVSRVAFHIDAVPYPLDLLHRIRACGMKAGVALNLKQPVRDILLLTSCLDYVIIMTSEPDGKGCLFYPPVMEKVKEARALLSETVEVWADGGVSEEYLEKLGAIGIDAAVLGRAVWGAADPAKQVKRWSKIRKGGGNDAEKICGV